jgi:hypothetical protein
MAVTWTTPAGDLGVLTERQPVSIPVVATSDSGDISYSVISGSLPRGLRLSGSNILGSPTEVTRFTESRFVVRADDGTEKKDRTFKLSVDGSDLPQWLTEGGFLNVGEGESYFVLDNANVNFQLSAEDVDEIAGDVLEYYLVPNSGELPPGLSLSRSGLISGFTKPVFYNDFNSNLTGAYDTQSFDTMPLDIAESKSNGYDSYFYDNQTFDYNEPSQAPKRLSRIYAFSIAVTDGLNAVARSFRIYVVTEEFLQADNSILQVDTNLFRADSSGDRVPFWITDPYLGRWRANNYVTIYLDVYDPPSLSGTMGYFLLANNPDGSPSQLPPGMELDTITGEIAGTVPYQAAVTNTYQFTMKAVNFSTDLAQLNYDLVGDWSATTPYYVNQAVRYNGFIYICTEAHVNEIPSENQYWTLGVGTADRTFTVDIIGEIESAITWVTPSDRGTIKPNQPSNLYVKAEALIYGGRITYDFVSGTLPPGLSFLPSGEIEGKVKQFADDDGDGLTRFYEHDSSLVDSTGSRSFTNTFDGDQTSFDRRFTFTIKAKDYANVAELNRTFTIDVEATTETTYANIFVKAMQRKDKRLEWFNFITDATIFKPDVIYRYGDPNFGIQSELKMLLFAGIESKEAVEYVQAMSRNHYRKRLTFGEVKSAKAKDPLTQETVYEIIYVDVVDPYEKDGKSISETIQLADDIESKVLVSYDSIKIDSDIPLVSDSDHQRIFPNSVKNMRRRIRGVGDRDREFLPLWMRSIQDDDFVEPGFTKALVLCYVKPGNADAMLSRINANGFDFKNINFEVDRYIIDILDGQIEDKYLAFPQRGEKLP